MRNILVTEKGVSSAILVLLWEDLGPRLNGISLKPHANIKIPKDTTHRYLARTPRNPYLAEAKDSRLAKNCVSMKPHTLLWDSQKALNWPVSEHCFEDIMKSFKMLSLFSLLLGCVTEVTKMPST